MPDPEPTPTIDPAPPPAPAPTPETKWYSGFDPETQNYINSRGLADKDPSAAFLEAAKAHREAQAYIGVPKEQLLKLPKADAPPEEWDAVYQRLGYSTNADDYKLEGLKFADGSDAEDSFKDFVRSQAAELKLSPEAAAKLAGNLVRHLEGAEAATTAEETAAATKAMEVLRQSWGPNYEANNVIANNAYEAMMKAAGFTQEQMSAATKQMGEMMGKAEAMQLFLAVGRKMGEDRFVGGGGPAGELGPRTSEEAVARIAELKADKTWVERYLAGGLAEKKEMSNLHTLAYGSAQQ